MTADELVNAALEAASPPKPIADLRRSRFTDGILVAAAQLLLAGERHGEDAEAIHTEAMSRARISAGHYKSLAGWTRDLIMVAIRNMITITAAAGPATKRKGRPPRNGAAMTNRERQAAFQARIRRAPDTIQKIKDVLAIHDVAVMKIFAIETLIKEYESEERS